MGKQHAANKKMIALDWLRLLFSVSGPTLAKVPESQVSFRSPESRVLLLGSQILGLRSWDGPRDSDLTFRVLGLWSRVLPLIRILGPGSRVPQRGPRSRVSLFGYAVLKLETQCRRHLNTIMCIHLRYLFTGGSFFTGKRNKELNSH